MIALTSYKQRREIREELNRLIILYVENCSCGGPQPSVGDLKLDQHRLDCQFVYLFEEKKEEVCRKQT